VKNRGFVALCMAATALSLAALAVLLSAMVIKGWDHLDTRLLTEFPSRDPHQAGLKAALWGSVWICAVCALTTLPLGVGTAVYLEEFAPQNRLTAFIRLNISNLAGVPSIVYGVLGLTVFVQMWGLNPAEPRMTFGSREDWYYFQIPFGRGVLAGGLTLMLVVLPIVIVASQEALRAVPDSLREAALASGATRWQMVSRVTLPAATPTIMTGAILAVSRAIGEAAPILVIAGIVFIRFTPLNLMDEFTAMPLQIYDWAGRPQEEFHKVAAAGIILLLAVLLSFNALANFIRQKLQKPMS
jgi:phosphate transport system permease protein